MFATLGHWVTRAWPLWILLWVLVAGVLHWLAPPWDTVALDGDFAYLPPASPVTLAERRLDEAFPGPRPRSQVVLVVWRDDAPLTDEDQRVADEWALPFLKALGAAQVDQAQRQRAARDAARAVGDEALAVSAEVQLERAAATAMSALDEAIKFGDRHAEALYNRSLLWELRGNTEAAQADRQTALRIRPELVQAGDHVIPARAAQLPLVDVYTRHSEVVGERLVSRDRQGRTQAVLIVIQLSTEFMATQNLGIVDWVAEERRVLDSNITALPDLRLDITGSAAVGSDMLHSASESLRSTELMTTVLVVAILLLVYRAPLLVSAPLITIAAAYFVSTSLVAALTQLHLVPGFEWWDLKVFKTSKIFIVVILFGSGTDFCLFLIARYKEELARGEERLAAMIAALSNVGEALAGSAFTTIVGLSMMYFAEYGKFSNSGPTIALCLLITLLACLTLTPALLLALGSWIYWPFSIPESGDEGESERRAAAESLEEDDRTSGGWWQWTADAILARPWTLLLTAVAIMVPIAWLGRDVTISYDFLQELQTNRRSRVGIESLRRFFSVGESGPVAIIAHLPDAHFTEAGGIAPIDHLTRILYLDEENGAEGRVGPVESVRSLAEPLGEPPRRISLLTEAGRQKLLLRNHRLSREHYLARDPALQPTTARLDVLLRDDPFSPAARRTLARLEQRLADEAADPASPWHGGEFHFAGTTAAIRDLAAVTQRDTRAIQIYVVAAVFTVLLVMLRNVGVSLYMMASVLLSYYFTLGVATLAFPFIFGDTYTGMDWKVPLFLFVILVAIGQDYNIYLVTRIFEETPRLGPREGLRVAIRTTGAIITSCGIIMAGSFVSMTAGSLRAIAELGFTLTFGILLDTFVVRTILLPAFWALGLPKEDPPAEARGESNVAEESRDES